MINIASFIEIFSSALNKSFGERVWFFGLQGSYGRGEATDSSDIDLVVILDELKPCDVEAYNNMLDTLPHRELIFGFLSGKKEILNWEPADLFQFYYDTKPIKGSLDDLLPMLDAAVDKAIKISVCNIYHGCVHNMLYEKSEEILVGLYKAASFAVQAKVFKRTGRYIKKQTELISAADKDERYIIEAYSSMKKGGMIQFREKSEFLFMWAGKLIEG